MTRVSEFKVDVTRQLATSKASFRALRLPPRVTRRGVKIQRVQLATRGGPTGSLNMRDPVGQHLPLAIAETNQAKRERERERERDERELQLSLPAVASRLPDAQDAPLSGCTFV